MCKPKLRRIRLSASLCISTLMGLYAFLLPTPKAQGQVVNNCTAGLNASCEVNPIVTRIGGTVTIIKVKAGTTAGDCGLTNVIGFIVKPSGNTQLALTNGTLVGNGTCIGCPVAGAPECGGPGNTVTCMAINDTYVVSPNDIGDPLSITFTDPKGGIQMLNNPGIPYSVQFMPAAAGIVPPGGNRSDLLAKGAGQCASLVINPCISITKECIIDCPPNNAAIFGQAIRFRGTVCNSAAPIPPQFDLFSAPQNGNDLTNIVIADSLPAGAVAGPIAFDANVTTNGVAGRAYDGSLRPGECIGYQGSYTPAGSGVALCGPFTNTISVTAVDRTGQTISNTDECFSTIGGTNYTSSGPRAPVRAICTVCTSPNIDVTKECLDPVVQAGSPTRYRFRVQNTGDVPLQNVRIVDDSFTPGIPGDDVTINVPGTLAPGAFFPSSGFMTNTVLTATAQCDGAGTITNTIVASGANICNPAQTVTDTDRCNVRVECPVILVYKQVVCYSNGVCEPFSPNLNTQKSATGIRLDPPNATNCPAFCYRITVINTGNVALTLTMSDNSTPDPDLNLSGCGFPAVLAPRGQPGSSAQCIIPAVTHCQDTLNVVTATGTTLSGTTVSARDTNNVTIEPIAITCILDVSTNGGTSFFTPGASCAEVVLGNSYIVRVRTRNAGQYPLQNVTITTTGVPLCFGSPLNIGGLAVGETKTNQCTFTCTVPNTTNRYSVSVVGEASQSPTHVCDFNAQGDRIVARSTCETCVICRGEPGLKVYKQVVCYSNGVCEAFSPDLGTQKSATGIRLDPPNATNCPAFCYRITVTNTGSLPLTLTVTDNSTPDPDLNLSGCLFPATLDVGQSAQCVVSAVTHCQNTLNVVTATGSHPSGGTVTARDTNNVTIRPISIICILDISTNGGASFITPGKTCPRVMLNSNYVVRVRTRNTGQHPLDNVTITTEGLPLCFGSPLNIGSLAINETKTNDLCTFTCSVPGTNRYSVSVVGRASQSPDHVCDFNVQGQQLVARSSCAACVECVGPPDIEVTKEIACVLPGDACGTFGKVATGVRDTACPAFCYRITITNVGTVPIVTLTVTDPVLGTNISSFFGPLPLAPGDTRTAIFKPIPHCADRTNTVRVMGRSADGQTDVDQDSAEARVLNIHILCTITLFSTNDLDGNPNNAHVLLPGSGLVEFTLTLTNTGSSSLNVVSLNGLPPLVDCTTGAPVVPALPINIGPSNSVTIRACTAVSCPAGAQYSVTARAEADDQNGTLCVYNRFGNRVTDETSCTALAECRPQAGCTPGFWKNCTIHWQLTGFTRGQSINSVFSLGNCCGSLGSVSLASALDFGGGSDVCGGARILLRAAVAALLNASSPEVEYPLTTSEVINKVNAALHSCNRGTIIALAGELDRNNNLGCRGLNNNSLPCQRLTSVP